MTAFGCGPKGPQELEVGRQAIASLSISSIHEGGNCGVVSLNHTTNTATLQSVLKGPDLYNIHFYCKINGIDTAQPFNLKIETFLDTPWNPVFSYDNVTWQRMGNPDANGFIHKTVTNSTIWVSAGFPYTHTKMVNWVGGLSSPHLQKYDAATSEGGKVVKRLRITDSAYPDTGKKTVWWIGRQHAFESPANYVTEGLVNFLLSSDARAVDLRKKTIVHVVPMVNVDAVFEGRSGKQNLDTDLPVDFNRSWDTSAYAAVNALKTQIASTVTSYDVPIVIDSHNPGYNKPTHRDYDRQRLFYYIWTSNTNRLNYLTDFVQHFNAASGYTLGSNDQRVAEGTTNRLATYIYNTYPEVKVSTTIETGWDVDPNNVLWTEASYRTSGENWGRAFHDALYARTELEGLSRTVSGCVINTPYTATYASPYGGTNNLQPFQCTAPGQWGQVTLNVAQAGTYKVRIGYAKSTNRGIVQLYIDHDASGAGAQVPVGSTYNTYAATGTLGIKDYGNVTFTAGNKYLRFQVVDKDPAFTLYSIVPDYIELIRQ